MPDKSKQGVEISSLIIGHVQLNEDLMLKVLNLWQNIFQTEYGHFRSILKGEECRFNRDIIYLAVKEGIVVSTCHLTQPLANTELGGLGEVCTVPGFRGLGIASKLCQLALDDFHSAGGRALFLGTANPAAALIYRRIGWNMLAAANVMVNLTNNESPEEFLSGYFVEESQIKIVRGTQTERIPIIPLIVTPHNWQVMDAIIGLFSTRYAVQHSCMGLYPRYERLLADGNGSWFALKNSSGQTVGLTSTQINDSKQCQVDGFVHHKYKSVWKDLINIAISWAMDQYSQSCWARLSVEDEEKISLFEASSFKKRGKGVSFDLDGREVAALCMELKV